MSEHLVVIEGLELPARLGGHPALDFCNTFTGWDGADRWDFLTGYDALVVWAGYSRLLSADRVRGLRARAAHHPASATRVVSRVPDVRRRLYAALRDPDDAGALERLAPDVAAATAHLRLSAGDGTPAWEIDERAGLTAPLHVALWSAAQLVTSDQRRRVRACPGTGCGWLFLDRSGRRRWCTMATCGNRAKARRFARRHREPR